MKEKWIIGSVYILIVLSHSQEIPEYDVVAIGMLPESEQSIEANIEDNYKYKEDTSDDVINDQSEISAQKYARDVSSETAKKSMITTMAFKLLNLLSSQDDNVVFSPFSIASCLALLQHGARGETLEELNTFLGVPPSETGKYFKLLYQSYELKINTKNDLKFANGLFISDEYQLDSTFSKESYLRFHTEMRRMDFNNHRLSAAKINDWVALATGNQIKNIVVPSSILNTLMIMVNAVYFKGNWETEFNPRLTESKDFALPKGVTNIPFMKTLQRLPYAFDSDNKLQIVSLPFRDNEYSLMIINPMTTKNLDEVSKNLSEEKLNSYNLSTVKVVLTLPKFDIMADIDLVGILKKMGISKVFTPEAELKEMFANNTNLNKIGVSEFKHKAVFSIDEKGGKAAAVTSASVTALSLPLELHERTEYVLVDGPFIAILWDNASEMPLFMAKIVSP